MVKELLYFDDYIEEFVPIQVYVKSPNQAREWFENKGFDVLSVFDWINAYAVRFGYKSYYNQDDEVFIDENREMVYLNNGWYYHSRYKVSEEVLKGNLEGVPLYRRLEEKL